MLRDLRWAGSAGRRAQRDERDRSCRQSLSRLVERAGQGDQEAFESLTDVLLPWVWTTVAGRARPDRLIQVSAAAMVLMWQRSPRFDASEGGVTQWAQTCTEDALAADEDFLATTALPS